MINNKRLKSCVISMLSLLHRSLSCECFQSVPQLQRYSSKAFALSLLHPGSTISITNMLPPHKQNKKSTMNTLTKTSLQSRKWETLNQEESKRCIEVEEKFSLNSKLDVSSIETKLVKLGFELIEGKEGGGKQDQFMDWYFDLPSPNWILSTSDNWFRYREVLSSEGGCIGKGQWQLKSGKVYSSDTNLVDPMSTNNARPLTVYEEFIGNEAIALVLSMIDENVSIPNSSFSHDDEMNKETTMDGYRLPIIPSVERKDNYGLVPFARIKTTRSSWAIKDDTDDDKPFRGLSVDFDCTDFGHMVGEVELVVDKEGDINGAKRLINDLITQITGNEKKDDNGISGKLELYLMQNRRDHFDACVKNGTMKERLY
mmetsp:Transcript_2791/g.3291  ORF Transcript_2791/g.3291 Transcript_2791/m.3291 type:complete len:371 (-) Transcript_2791:294-1406(-)